MTNYNEMTMVELKEAMTKKQKEYDDAIKVCEPLYKSYVEDMTKYMTKMVNGMDIKVGAVILTSKRNGYKATIMRMGKKCVFLNDGGWKDDRYEIDDVATWLMNGDWELVK